MIQYNVIESDFRKLNRHLRNSRIEKIDIFWKLKKNEKKNQYLTNNDWIVSNK